MPDASTAVRGVDKPQRPQASPLFRLVPDHLHRLQTVYDDRFAREHGPRRPRSIPPASCAARPPHARHRPRSRSTPSLRSTPPSSRHRKLHHSASHIC